MILLDTNIFVIDRFFPRDARYAVNKQFFDRLPEIEAGLSIFSLFELCGISSFNLSPEELKRWSYYFDELYHVDIIAPVGLEASSASSWFRHFSMTFVRNGINNTIKTFRPCRERIEHPKQPFVGGSRQYLGQNWPLCERFGSSKFQLCGYLDSGQRSC